MTICISIGSAISTHAKSSRTDSLVCRNGTAAACRILLSLLLLLYLLSLLPADVFSGLPRRSRLAHLICVSRVGRHGFK